MPSHAVLRFGPAMTPILSIQSHVAYGYVGNRVAGFVLQRLGFDAMVVNTVQFSNHTGYGTWTGQVFPPAHIAEVIDGIAARGGLEGCAAVLSGYTGDAGVGDVILDAVDRVRAQNPDAVYCCDPVMGDVGRGFFVRPGIPDFMQARMVPAADLVAPNAFELAFLTGRTINTPEQAAEAAHALRGGRPRWVLVTSVPQPPERADRIGMLLATDTGTWSVTTPLFPLDPLPNGAGDGAAALFLACRLRGASAPETLAHVAGALHALFAQTHAAGTRELQLIAAQDALLRPDRAFEVEKIG